MVRRHMVHFPFWAGAFALGFFLVLPRLTTHVVSGIGYRYYFSSNYQQAQMWFEKAIKVDQTVPSVWRGLAKTAEQQGQKDAALEALGQTLLLQPQNDFARIERADLHWQRGDVHAAYADWKEINTFDAILFLGNRAIAGGDLDNAVVLFKIAIEKDPMRWRGYYALGSVFLRQADYDRAEEAFRAALQLAPDTPPILLSLGKAQVGDDRCEDALASFTRITELKPLNWTGWYWSGLCWERLNMYEKALNAFVAAAELNPTDPNVNRAVNRLQDWQSEN